MSGGESKLLHEVPGRFGAPESVADFDAGGDVDDEWDATVVAQQPRLAADADEAFDLGASGSTAIRVPAMGPSLRRM